MNFHFEGVSKYLLQDLEDDLLKKEEVVSRLQEEKTKLQAEVILLDTRIKKLTFERMEVNADLKASQTSERELTTKVCVYFCYYNSCLQEAN